LQLIKNVHKQDAVLYRIPAFEKAVSRVLRDIKVVRRYVFSIIEEGSIEYHNYILPARNMAS
jgi:hypothetical protein